MPRRRSVALLVLLLAGCGGADRVGSGAGDPRVLTLMNPIRDVGEITTFTQEVARRSHGSLRIRIVRSPHQDRTDYERPVIDDVRAGRADLAWTGSRAWDGSLRALHAPLLIDSYTLEQQVLEDAGLVRGMLDELRPEGLVGIGVLPGPLRRPLGLRGPLVVPADYDGLAIGQQQSRVAVASLRALGARPVALPVDGEAPGLDGVETSMAAIDAGRYDAPGTHLTENVDLWPRPLVVFANGAAYGKLSDDQRRVLREAAAAAVPRMTALNRAGEGELAGNLCRRGTSTIDTASDEQLELLRATVAPVYAELRRDPATRAALDAIVDLKRALAVPPATLSACEQAEAPATGTGTRLDGTWRMDTGRSASAPDFLEENWGHWIFVFDRGHFAITQENKPACTWGYGTYTVDGDVTTWRFTDGGGDMPNDASNKPGEQFAYRLSVYRDTATLGAVRGAVSPPNFKAKPWRRLGPPTVARFSRRCPPPAEALAPLG